MNFDVEGLGSIPDPTELRVKSVITSMRSYGPSSYASLTDDSGNYIQVAGGGVTCMLEYFCKSTGERFRAYQNKPSPVFPDGTLLVFGAGELALQSDEWFSSDRVTEAFLWFLKGENMFEKLTWRRSPPITD